MTPADRLTNQASFMGQSAGTEDEPMTLQIALIAKDGWAFASDTRGQEFDPAVGNEEGTRPYTSQKIFSFSDSATVYGFSGTQISRQAGVMLERDIASVVQAPQRHLRLNQLAHECWNAHATLQAPGQNRLMVIFFGGGSAPDLWTVDLGRVPAAEKRDWALAGGANLARFIPHAYIEQLKPADRTVQKLAHFAAHTIVTASRFSSGVFGLDLWTWKHDDPVPVHASPIEIEKLLSWSASLHAELPNKILDSNIILR